MVCTRRAHGCARKVAVGRQEKSTYSAFYRSHGSHRPFQDICPRNRHRVSHVPDVSKPTINIDQAHPCCRCCQLMRLLHPNPFRPYSIDTLTAAVSSILRGHGRPPPTTAQHSTAYHSTSQEQGITHLLQVPECCQGSGSDQGRRPQLTGKNCMLMLRLMAPLGLGLQQHRRKTARADAKEKHSGQCGKGHW
jgi:hypothetical protein